MSESLKINSEQMENVSEQEEENDYPEFRGDSIADDVREQPELPKAEDAREMVMEAIATKKKEESETIDAEKFAAVREAMNEFLRPEKIPNRADDVSGWIEDVDRLPREHGIRVEPYSHGYDTLAHSRLSEKHGGDMLPADRERAYSLIRENHDDELTLVSTTPATMMICAMKNLRKVSENERMDSSDRQKSMEIEEGAMEYFEGKAVDAAPDLAISDIDGYEKGLSQHVTRLETVARMEHEYMEGGKSPKEREKMKKYVEKYFGDIAASFPNTNAEERAKMASRELEKVGFMRQAMEQSGPKDETFKLRYGSEYKRIKTLKFLYDFAKKQEESVTGFGNKRRVKKDEQFALPGDFEELARNPERYDEGHFRNIITECVEMEER